MKGRWDAQRIRRRLWRHGFVASIEPSVLAGSPHEYVYVWLSDQKHEGPHIIVSEQCEWEPGNGMLVGWYKHFETQGVVEVAYTIPAVIAKVKKMRREALGENTQATS